MKTRTGPTATAAAAILLAAALTPACRHSADVPPVETPAADAAATPPDWQLDWADGAVFYEIFVRSFADSDGDGIGDLAGLTARLDYLNDGDPATDDDLGVEGIWLMPIFVSPSYHGYDTVDYSDVNPDYGDLEDLRRLLEEAHRRGIRVIVDLMVNHTGVDHPWFRESAASPDNPRRDWYVWRPDDPGWTQPWSAEGDPVWHPHDTGYYYGIFWSGMPDLDFRNPEVREEVHAIAAYWLGLGLDGFRLDAARHLVANGDGELQNDQPETHAFWKEFAARVRGRSPDKLLVGENWTDTPTIATYYGSTDEVAGGDELPMSFNFPLAGAVLDGVLEGTAAPVLATLQDMATHYPPGVLDGTFLTNHDMPRVATQLGGQPALLRSAAAVLLPLPGTPFVYYGEEIGMTGAKPDPDIRTPMQWSGDAGAGFTTGEPWRPANPDFEVRNVAAQTGDPGSLLSWYRTLIHLRAETPALRRGGIEVLDAPGEVLAFTRGDGAERVLVLHNLGPRPVAVGDLPLAPGSELLLASADGIAVELADRSVLLPARTSAVLTAPE